MILQCLVWPLFKTVDELYLEFYNVRTAAAFMELLDRWLVRGSVTLKEHRILPRIAIRLRKIKRVLAAGLENAYDRQAHR